jgi:hypothetical protein
MRPIVHGLEAQYETEIEFVYVNIDDPASDAIEERYGFRYQPHFVLVDSQGQVVQEWLGIVDAADFEQALAGVAEES